MAHLTSNSADKERFLCIYPAYINSKKTLAEGRRIPTEKNKMYPREWNRDGQFRGRVRVQVKKEDGSLCQDKFTCKKDIMFYVAEMIPKLKTRTQKSGGGDSGAQPGEGGKKGKKKKK
ncbi:signal recognition particle 19 kDa protein isoform X2 [Electrophorus electricus]|uniref:signal recognition particle 19 kDa protein isoform X2 n=1 Tax=Electrophorus electricus TaxID=8005 RepID=UPI000F09F23C|nr:signal recognition particle 19 kDa protein isoform X2 [Electrophorus electricus]